MKKMVKKTLAILNLAGELSPGVSEYFIHQKINIISPLDAAGSQELTHILVKDLESYNEIEKQYGTNTKDIRLISLSQVSNLQDFIHSNGKLVLDPVWMSSGLGRFILDKFFQEYGGIAIGDNYPTFKEKGSFNITNPFNTGEYLDRMIYDAFTGDMNGLSIKTYFDHLIMYLSGLKTQDKLGLPIEVSYGYFEDVFGVQLHFFTKGFHLRDVISSLSANISRDAEKYLLNIAVQSSDFFDLTVLHEVNKTVVTGLWSKDKRIKYENRGILLNELTSAAPITNYPTDGITSFLTTNTILEDLSAKILLPANEPLKDAIQVIEGGEVRGDNFAQTVTGNSLVDDGPQNIQGGKEEKEIAVTVEGSNEEQEALQRVQGKLEEDELINLVKGKIEEEEHVFKISGSKNFDLDQFVNRVASGLEDKAKNSDFMTVKNLSNSLPETIKDSFHSFISNLDKQIDDVNENDLEKFKNIEVPKIIKKTIASTIVTERIYDQNDKAEELKMKALSAENGNLKSKIRTLMTEVKILKEAKAQMLELHQKALKAVEAANINSSMDDDTALKELYLQKLKEQKHLNEIETQKLASVMERETQYLKNAKEDEIKIKKLHLELVQKEAIFGQELEKFQRQIKIKDGVILKIKDSLNGVIEQKDQELKNLNIQLQQFNSNNHQTNLMTMQISELERKVQNQEKMIEIYKGKLTQKSAHKDDETGLKDENRRLKVSQGQLQKQLDSISKELKVYKDRTNQDTLAITTLKEDKIKLEQLLKKFTMEAIKADGNPPVQQAQKEIARLTSLNESLDGQLKEAANKHKELEAKLQEALKAQKKEVAIANDDTKGKLAILENNIRKLTNDLVENRNQLAKMKKENNKLRQEKVALQNTADRLKKEADKTKAAAPKKPTSGNSGGKAA